MSNNVAGQSKQIVGAMERRVRKMGDSQRAQRPHSALDGRTPDRAYFGAVEMKKAA